MKKTWKRKINRATAYMLIFAFVFQISAFHVLAADDAAATDSLSDAVGQELVPEAADPPETTESAGSVQTGNSEQKYLDIVLNCSLQEYFASSTETEKLPEIEKLIIRTEDGYCLTDEDLIYLQQNMPVLSFVDLTEAAFASRDCQERFRDYFKTAEYYDTEGTYEQPETGTGGEDTDYGENTEIPPDAATENQAEENSNQYVTEPQEKSSVALTGICLLDRGSYLEVGTAYETNDPGIEFRWLQYDLQSQVWTEVSSWSQGNWATWKPGRAGDYWIYVEARTSGGTIVSDTYGYHYAGIKVKLNGMCVLDRGTYYDFGISYETNDAGLKFQWKLYDLSSKKWFMLHEAMPGNWISWSPNKAGDYLIYVEAIDSLGDITTYSMGFHFDGLKTTLNGICLIDREDRVDMGVAYTTNDSGLKFRWLLYDLAEKKWTVISDWSTGNWTSWKPHKAGDYWLYVEAKTSTGEILSQVYGHHISGAKITSLTANPASPYWVGEKIQLTGKKNDPIGEVKKERYLVYNGQYWSELPQNDAGAEWIPGALGTYLLCYEIYGDGSAPIEQKFLGYSIESPYVTLNGIYIRNEGNMSYSMAVNASTNDRGIQYRWMYYDISNSTWHEICGWNGLNAVAWTAPKAGSYWIHVEAQLHDGTVKSYTMGLVVRRYQNPAGYYQIQDSISLSGGDYNLMYGFEGLKVMYVMRALGVGYGIGMGGAFYGNNVILAVKAFQQNHGLPVNGIVDRSTWLAMGFSDWDWYNLGAYVSPMKVNANSTREEHIEAMISTAYSYLGTPYVIGASGAPGTGVDCSGLVMQALYAAGIDTSPINPVRHSYPGYEYESANMWASPYFKHVSYAERQRGDLIFYQNSSGAVIHVAIYLGNDQVIESWPNQVVVWPVKNGQRSNIKGVVRPFV